MKRTLYKIDGPAGVKYSCLVPQKKHSFTGLGISTIDVDTMTLALADELFLKTKEFLVETQKAEANTAAAGEKKK